MRLVLVGNPNCGKTTIFNAITGSNQRVGNWPGVTVERKEGEFSFSHVEGTIIDLPGIYSLNPDSEDEMVSRKYLCSDDYDLMINVVDASNLERNLYLTTQLKEMNIPLVVILNKEDVAKKQGFTIDNEALSKALETPVLSVSAVDPHDLKELANRLDSLLLSEADHTCDSMIAYPEDIERFISDYDLPKQASTFENLLGKRSIVLSLLEHDPIVTMLMIEQGMELEVLEAHIKQIEESCGEDLDIILAESRYSAINRWQKDVIKKDDQRKRFNLDTILMHRIWGVPIFFGVMYLVFFITMTVGGAFIDFFDIFAGTIFVDGFGTLLNSIGSPQWLTAFLAGGIGGGIQTISTFIPMIFFMFLMLGIIEDSGYMGRAAFVMDRFMRVVGLPGKAFIPMLVGFGCTVPAILATRTLESKRDRFLAIFMTPFMSCGARLPVYALFAAAFFGTRSGLVVFSIYMVGILLAIGTGLLLKSTLFQGSFSPFIMELPGYNRPHLGKVVKYGWDRLKIFLLQAGKVIMIVVMVLTLLNSIGIDGSFGNEDSENSILSYIGKKITPIFTPMGIREENWPATVGLFTGIFAKESVVGTLNSLYLAEEGNIVTEDFEFFPSLWSAFTTLGENLAGIFTNVSDPLGFGIIDSDTAVVAASVEADPLIFQRLRENFTPVSAYAYLLFILIYMPCVAALGAIFREAGTFYGILQTVYLSLLAWIVSVLFYQIGEGHSLFWIAVAMGIAGMIVVSLKLIGRRDQKIVASTFL